MEKAIQVIIESIYGTAMVAVMFFLIRMILRARIDVVTPLVILACWIAGEVVIHREPMGLGIAIYSCGNALLFLYGVRITGPGMSRGTTLALLPLFLLAFVGYFVPTTWAARDPFLIINVLAIYLFIINSILFARAHSRNRWFYGAAFALMAFWNGGLTLHYLRTGIIITDYGHPFMMACKAALGLLLVILAIRFFLQGREKE